MTTPAPTSPPPMPNDLLHERVKAVCYCETPLIEAIENSWRDGWSAALAAQPPEPHKEVMPLAETKDEKRIVEQPPSITGGGAPPQPGDTERLERMREILSKLHPTRERISMDRETAEATLRLLDAAQSALAESNESCDDWHRNCLTEQDRAIEAERALADLQLSKQAGDEVICGQALRIDGLHEKLAASQAEVARLTEIIEAFQRDYQDTLSLSQAIVERDAALSELAASQAEVARLTGELQPYLDAKARWEEFERLGEPYRPHLNPEDHATQHFAAARARGVQEGMEMAANAVRQIDTPDTLTNDWAFGWEHCRDKAVLAIRALAAPETPP